MDVFNFCWSALHCESNFLNFCKKNGNFNDVNFKKNVDRVSYFYKFGSFNILFFQRCMNDFVTKVPAALQMLDVMCSKNLNICSLSRGPGTDIIGFLSTLNQLGKSLKKPANFGVINKYAGNWSKLVEEMINSQMACTPPAASTCKIFQCDVLKTLSRKAKSNLKIADVILMCHLFTLEKVTKTVTSGVLKAIIQLLKPGAVIFFISDEENSTYFKELDTCGTLWHGPVRIQLENMPYNAEIAEQVGTKPLCSGSSYFTVWQKSDSTKNETPTEIKNILCKGTIRVSKINELSKKIGSVNLSKLEGQKETVLGAGDLSHSTSSSCKKNESILSAPDKEFSLKNIKGNALIEGECEADASEDSLNLLLKRFKNLVTALEKYAASQSTISDSELDHVSSHKCCNQMYRSRYSSSYCCNCRLHSACDRNSDAFSPPHSVTRSNSFNCYHSSTNFSNCRIGSSSQNPCIVIPLQNLKEDSLASILSLISQNKLPSNVETPCQ